MTLRDLFAVHAPKEPAHWFQPVMPEAPERPNPMDAERFPGHSHEDRQKVRDWAHDPVYDPDETYPADIVAAYREYWDMRAEWTKLHRVARIAQWPYAYADAVITAACADGNDFTGRFYKEME